MGALSRRDLFAAAAAGLATTAFPQALRPPPKEDDLTWEGIRGLFDLDPEVVHLAGMLLASHPRPVADEIERVRRLLDQNPADAWQRSNLAGEGRARARAAAYLKARPSDVALTGSTTEGLALLYNGISVRPDQEILTTVHDHAATSDSLEFRSARSGVPVRAVQLYDDPATASVDGVLRRLRQAIRPQTRVLAVTWVHSSTGVPLPISRMSDVVREANRGRAPEDRILFCVDGVHGLGVVPIDVHEFGCDFFAAGTHKWLFGPRGTGILWGRPEVQDMVSPTVPTFSGSFTWGQRMTPGGFHAFEHRWALDKAFDFHLKIKPERIQERIHALARRAKEGLARNPRVKLYTPASDDLSAGIVCFDVDGVRQNEVVRRLRERGIVASTTPYAVSYARFAPGILNTPEEVDRAVEAVARL
jgi:isopenicillin-N epimerase